MKSKQIVFLLIALAIVGGGAFFVLTNNKSDSGSTSNTSSSDKKVADSGNFKVVKACDILTKEIAEKIVGGKVEASDNKYSQASSESVDVSTCGYTEDNPSKSLKDTLGFSILVRAAKDNDGASSNKDAFGPSKPAGAQDISGYGDKAFWDANLGQLNVLKGGNWYILSSGIGLSPEDNTLDSAKKLAEAIIDKM